MNLRVRITLIVCVSFLAFVALLLLDGRTREATVEAWLRNTVANDLRTSWQGLIGAERQRLLRFADQLRNTATPEVVARDADALARATIDTRARLRTSVRDTELQAVSVDGRTFFDTRTGNGMAEAPTILRDRDIRQIVEQAQAVDGLVRTAAGDVVYAYAAPVFGRGGVGGLIVLHTDLDALVAELAELTGARTVIRTADGAMSGDPAPWARDLVARLADLADRERPAERVRLAETEGRSIQVAMMALKGPFAERLGVIASLRDITDEVTARERISRLSYFGLACTLVIFLAFVNWYLRYSFRPLNAVIRSLKALSVGRTDVSVSIPDRNDEIGRLAGTFESFRKGIVAREQLKTLQQELAVAARIQDQCLPSRYPENPEVACAVTIEPAREVGGDFYDMFDLPDGRVGFVIADVSDKGVGAALFMAASRTVIRSTAALTSDPADCLQRANDYLAEDNAAMMFVTVFYAILDPTTGELAYCNAGHNPPGRIATDGTPTLLPQAMQPALGVMEGFPYETETITLARGEQLFLYTDGVTEAMNDGSECFDEDRLLQSLGAEPDADPARRMARVLEDVGRFVAGAAQSDDITCLTFAYRRA